MAYKCWNDDIQGLEILLGLWGAEDDVLPVVTDHGDTDQSAAADRHGDEEGQPVGAAFWKTKHWRLNSGRHSPDKHLNLSTVRSVNVTGGGLRGEGGL